jgi:hypothetical protein
MAEDNTGNALWGTQPLNNLQPDPSEENPSGPEQQLTHSEESASAGGCCPMSDPLDGAGGVGEQQFLRR